MRLLMEDRLLEVEARIFYEVLVEYLSKTDKIQKANYYWKKEHPNGKFNPKFMRAYAKQFPIADIKNDILQFVIEFANKLKSNKDITRILSYKSPDFGFSTYMHIDFTKPTDSRLKDYVLNNSSKYNNVKFRFSEHDEYSETQENKKAKDKVEFLNKNFIEASQEMESKILSYINALRTDEQTYISEIESKEKDNKKSDTKESFKLRISEGVLINERLEEVAPSTYATDSAQDIANWLVNKPKPYRVIYDRIYDVWCIADANMQTHKDMAVDLFDSDYLYGVAKDLDGDIKRMREEDNLNSGWTDAESYCDYQFDHYYIKGLMFIPTDMNYRDYEESGFYSNRIEINTGTIFVQRYSEFTDGIFKSLYYKLKIMGAIKPEIETLFNKALVLKDSDKIIEYMYTVGSQHGYSEDEIARFLDTKMMQLAKI